MNARTAIRADVRANARPQLRLVANTQTPGAESASARRTPALATWRLQRTSSCALPCQLARQLIAHYSDPGQLVLVAGNAGAALAEARRLGRRALRFKSKGRANTTDRPTVIRLRPRERADLAIAALHTADTQRLADRCAQLSAELKPGGFLILALARETHAQLGTLVRDCQRHGLQYWQHIVAIEPTLAETETAQEEFIPARARDVIRCHRDLLVFRRTHDAVAVKSEAIALTERAA